MKTILPLLLAATACLAQNEDKQKYFRIEFQVKEIEAGRTLSSRSYGMNVTDLSKGSIRAGDKVPVAAAKEGSFTFLDVGVNIDWSMQGASAPNQLRMQVTADVSNVSSEKPGAPPLINQTKSSSTLSVPFGKATNIFAADGATTKRQMVLDVTVTPLP